MQLTWHDGGNSDGESDGDSDDNEEVVARYAALNATETPRAPLASPADVDAWKPGVAVPVEVDTSGDELVGCVVSCLDVNGDRQEAKVVVNTGGGTYMVRTKDMQFSMELDAAMMRREAWLVSKPK